MPLLIDCYNVLHETMPPVLAGLDEAGLCVALSRSAFRHERAVVVCDGRPKPLRASESPVPNAELVFSGGTRSADALIVDLIDRDTAPRRLVVVSSDREIRKAARRRRAQSWTSDRFVVELAASLGQAPPADPSSKPSGPLTDEQTRRWLDAFGVDDGPDRST